jgi:hypothetical protein
VKPVCLHGNQLSDVGERNANGSPCFSSQLSGQDALRSLCLQRDDARLHSSTGITRLITGPTFTELPAFTADSSAHRRGFLRIFRDLTVRTRFKARGDSSNPEKRTLEGRDPCVRREGLAGARRPDDPEGRSIPAILATRRAERSTPSVGPITRTTVRVGLRKLGWRIPSNEWFDRRACQCRKRHSRVCERGILPSGMAGRQRTTPK